MGRGKVGLRSSVGSRSQVDTGSECRFGNKDQLDKESIPPDLGQDKSTVEKLLSFLVDSAFGEETFAKLQEVSGEANIKSMGGGCYPL